MKNCYKFISSFFFVLSVLMILPWLISSLAFAQQSDRPFSIELNAGGGLIGNSAANTAFQPELGVSYMPGSWGIGLNAGIYSFDSDFSASQYQTGYEQFTATEVSDDQWSAFYINAGPRFQQNLSRLFRFNAGLDLALSQQNAPSQSVQFNDPTGELESSGVDTDLVLAEMNESGDSGGWSAAVRPQVQLEFTPGFSDRFSFNVKTGIQHQLSDREITYTERDLSRVVQVDSPFEMHRQFENAPIVERTERAPKTNFFANAGIKIWFGGSRAPGQDYNAARSNKPTSRAVDISDGDLDSDNDGIEDGVEMAQDYNSSRSNKPSSIADGVGDGDPDSDDDGIDDAIETAQDYNSSRSNKYSSIADDRGGNDEIIRDASRMARLVNPAGMIVKVGSITAKGKKALGLAFVNGNSPIYEGDAVGVENVLNRGEMNDGDSDNNNNEDPVPVKRYDLQPASYCVSLSIISNQVLKTFFQTGDKPAAPQYDGDAQIAEDDGDTRSFIPTRAKITANNELRVCLSEEFLTQEEFADLIDSYIHREEDGIYLHVDGSKENVYCWGNNELRECPGKEVETSRGGGSGKDTEDLIEQDSDSTARAIPPSITGLEVTSPENLKPDTDQDGFPEMMKNASFSISKRSARTGRSQNPIHEEGGNMQTNPMYESEEMASGNGGDMDADADGFHLELEIDDMRSRVSEVVSEMDSETPSSRADSSSNAPPGMQVAPSQTKVILLGITDNGDIIPLEESKLSEFDFNGDPDSDDDGLMDSVESATFSISKRSARTGRSESQENPLAQDSGWHDTPELEVAPRNDVYQWTYKLNELSGGEELPGNGTLTVLFTGGKWHFDVQLDPDSDDDGITDLIQNSSFSISKRSARQ